VWSDFKADVDIARERRSLGFWSFVFPCVVSVGLYRVAHALGSKKGLAPLARAIQILDLVLTGAELDWRAEIGPGLFLEHPHGVCVGDGAVIGSNVVMGIGVVLGAAIGPSHNGGFPSIGNNVQLWAKASVIGPVHVGDGAIVGAHALVLKDVPPGAVARGVPAKSHVDGQATQQ
jgi:serine O-acetyltransferase